MPELSRFFGISIRMYFDDHNPPHFHVEYAEQRAVVEIATGRVLAGNLPARVRQLVEEWRRLNLRPLRAAWQEAQQGRQPRRIRPLT